MADDIIERLRLSHAVVLGDLWDETRNEVIREAYRQVARDMSDGALVIQALTAERDALRERVAEAVEILDSTIGLNEQFVNVGRKNYSFADVVSDVKKALNTLNKGDG